MWCGVRRTRVYTTLTSSSFCNLNSAAALLDPVPPYQEPLHSTPNPLGKPSELEIVCLRAADVEGMEIGLRAAMARCRCARWRRALLARG